MGTGYVDGYDEVECTTCCGDGEILVPCGCWDGDEYCPYCHGDGEYYEDCPDC